MNNNANNTGVWPVLIVLFVFGALFAACIENNSTPTSTTFTPDTSSMEYRYAKERVKLEGYSDREAAQAADAIVRFHEAQKARKK